MQPNIHKLYILKWLFNKAKFLGQKNEKNQQHFLKKQILIEFSACLLDACDQIEKHSKRNISQEMEFPCNFEEWHLSTKCL